MIYYFSGTGNSRFVANTLSDFLNEDTKPITETDPENETLSGESLGFVFPVYAWGIAPPIINFIEKLSQSFKNDIKTKRTPVWSVMTCGDEVAMAPEMLIKKLKKNDIAINSIWSVIMPNNYVLLPGFDVDSKEVEASKLKNAPARIKEIAKGIKEHDGQTPFIDVTRGSLPILKSALVYPLFRKWGIFAKKWRSTPSCVGCGICEKACPMHNIHMKDRHPEWAENCCSCVACYHSCPRHAIEYGNQTHSKGQYYMSKKM